MNRYKDNELSSDIILYEFKHSKIIQIKQEPFNIEVHFENSCLIFNIYEKRTDYLGYTIDYRLNSLITILDVRSIVDEVRLDITKIVSQRLCKYISIIKHSHRYNMSYNILYRFQEWEQMDNYHKCFKLKSLNSWPNFKYILKNWSSFEQLFRIHLWARQCLISFLTSRGKLYELNGDKEWIISQTPHFWLYEFLVHETVDHWNPDYTTETKKVINKYRSQYGDKQDTQSIFHAMQGPQPYALLVTGSVVHLSLSFLKQFNIVFGKKSKWCIKRVKEIKDKCRKNNYDSSDHEFLKRIISTNFKSLIWNFEHIRLKTKKEYKVVPMADDLFDVLQLAANAETTEEDRKNMAELAAHLEQFKLTIT